MKRTVSFLIIFAMIVYASFFASCNYLLNGYDPDEKNKTTAVSVTETALIDRTGQAVASSSEEDDHGEIGEDATDTETVSPFAGITASDDPDGTGAAGEKERIKWEIDEDGVLTLSGTGDMPDYKNGSDTPWYKERESIRTAVIAEGVTKISGKAFSGFTSLEEVKIPDSVKTIEDAAFSYCSALKKITVDPNNPNYSSDGYGALYNKNKTYVIQFPAAGDGASYAIPDSVKKIGAEAFRGCSGLKELDLKKGVTEIGDYAFGGCAGLQTVEIPSTLKTIGNRAFASCTDLKRFTVDEKNLYYSSDSDGSLLNKEGSVLLRFPSGSETTSYSIPDNVKQIGDFAFAYCDGMESITVHEGITDIGAYSFLGCYGIKEINIPASVKRVGEHAFDGCSGLKKITVSENNARFSSDVSGALFDKDMSKLIRFPANCSDTSYTVPANVAVIERFAFDGCIALVSVTVPENVKEIREGAFTGCTALKTVVLPEGLTKIDDMLFAGCAELKTVTTADKQAQGDRAADLMLPDSVVSAGVRAFEGCASIETAILPVNTSKIYESAFAYCGSMREITIPDSVRSIGKNAFEGCTSLRILCSKDSSARKYAEQYGIRYGKA